MSGRKRVMTDGQRAVLVPAIRAAMKAQGFTYADLADELDVSLSHLAEELWHNRRPAILLAAAKYLGVTVPLGTVA